MSKSKLNKQVNTIIAAIEAANHKSFEAQNALWHLSYGASQAEADILHDKMSAAQAEAKRLKDLFKYKKVYKNSRGIL